MNLSEMIRRRRSCRSYTGIPVEDGILEQLRRLELIPLYPDIRIHWEIVPREQVRCLCPWTTPQLISVYSEKKEGYLENAGFLFQQLDLQLQCLGLGVCWLGMGRPDPQSVRQIDGMEFVIMLAFGHPRGDVLRKDPGEFKRKALAEISDREDPRLEPARLAPSSVNSQPWYFIHEGETIHAFCARKGLLKSTLTEMNRIDMGIALAHMYLANPETFSFFTAERQPDIKGFRYIGSFTISPGSQPPHPPAAASVNP